MWKQIEGMLDTLLEADAYLCQKSALGEFEENKFLLDDMIKIIETVSQLLEKEQTKVAIFNMDLYKNAVKESSPCNELQRWVQNILSFAPEKLTNYVEKNFNELLENIEKSSKKKLVDKMKTNFAKWCSQAPEEYVNLVINFPPHFWGEINPQKNKYAMFEDRANCLKSNSDDFAWLFEKLCDQRSKGVLYGILQYWMDMDTAKINQLRELQFPSYFDLDLVACTSEEVFVDAGAYIGDTAKEYIDTYGKDCYKKIYCYDIVSKNLRLAKETLKEYENVETRLAGVGSENGQMFLQDAELDEMVLNAASLKKSGGKSVPVVKLDDDIKEPITFLKMDIEGAEYDALLGAKRHITEERPKLAICLYHSNQDLWRLPRLIYSMCTSYKFYLRMYGPTTNYFQPIPFASDYVLYCIPE